MLNKTKLSVLLIVLGIGLFLTACYQDVTVPELAPEITEDVSFSNDILPIFSSECTSCHGSGGTAPDLSSSNAFSSLSGSSYLDMSSPENSELYRLMSGLSDPVMPPSGANQSNAALVLAWIKQGALNN